MKKLIFALLFLFAAAQADAKPYLDIQKLESPKKIAFWFVRDETVPIVTLQFSLLGGSQLDADGKEGATSLLSTLLDEGAGKYKAEEFQDDLDRFGVQMRFNAGIDRFSGSLRTTMLHKSEAVQLWRAALNDAHLDKDAVERMRQALLSEQRFQKMDPSYMAQKSLMENLFPGHAYAREVNGTEQSLRALSRDDVVAVRKKLFCRERLKIGLVGALSPDQAQKLVDDLFGEWKSCDGNIETSQAALSAQGKTVHVAWDGAQNTVLMAQTGVARQNKDWWAARIIDFALGGGEFSSRLMDEVRVKRGLTYGASSQIVPYDLAPLWMVSAGVAPEKTDAAVALMQKIWGDVAKSGLTAAEMAEAKSYLIGSLPLALTSSGQIASILLQLQEDGLPADTLDRRAAEINAATDADIKRVAAQYLHADQLTTVIVGPQPTPLSSSGLTRGSK